MRLPPNDRTEQSLNNLVSLSLSVPHPNILSLYGWVRKGTDMVGLVTERVLGVLSDVVDTLHSYRDRVETALDVSAALCHLHNRGIVLGDLSPHTFFVTEAGQTKLGNLRSTSDYMARTEREREREREMASMSRPRGMRDTRAEQSSTAEREREMGLGYLAGDPSYLAPEMVIGGERPSKASDLFGLGSLLFLIGAGSPAFPANAYLSHILSALKHRHLPSTASLPPYFSDIVVHLWSERPEERGSGKGVCRYWREVVARIEAGE
ncbi:hypothetical protein KIPB_010334 [Kipferlia bialata]|uniref:Protein kinase domain-containing protein n=1 Tax=Kipferlia bialata TaxID=797122 RepID=A0A9K3GMU4_9EUKA|nr:hypothetical protein KIPB_010334 [Kipferlia bialata]|eukprot:g10334.t1